jgi:uncharacterized membrane protein YvlD (DUF360 family)
MSFLLRLLINAKLLSLPILIVTLGLFIFVINALMLRLTGWVSGLLGLGFYVEGFWPAFVGGLIVSIVIVPRAENRTAILPMCLRTAARSPGDRSD